MAEENKRRDEADIETEETREAGQDSWQNPDELSLEGNPPGSERFRSVEESPLDYLYADADKSDREGEEDFTQEPGEAYADYLVVGSDDDGVMDQIDDYTDDEDTLDDFADRQRLHSGSDKLLDSLREHHSQSPQVSGGDVDAAWDSSVVSGEESVGSTVPTPDQDVVDELGEALGISYADDEPLSTADKLDERDQDRWELNPASAMSLDELERSEQSGDEDDLEELDDDLEEELLDALDEDEEEDEEDLDEQDEDDDGEYNGYDEDELEDELESLDDLDEDDDDLFDDLDDDLWDDEEDD